MVAKQTKSRRASPRRTETDPVERARAEAAKVALASTTADAAVVAP